MVGADDGLASDLDDPAGLAFPDGRQRVFFVPA
jgi:hypothetical protein